MLSSSISKPDVTLIGCGKMGGAMLRSWIANDAVNNVKIFTPEDLPDKFTSDTRVQKISENEINSDIIIIAVKPQIIANVAQNICKHLEKGALILSIAAGKNITTLNNLFGIDKKIIRTMPNTPAAIGKGVSVSVAAKNVNQNQIKIADNLLKTIGLSEWIEDESLMDAVTALSGSGPAYIFYLIEALAKSGENIGLSHDLANKLARQTVIGSAALAEHEKNLSAKTLRENVTSPNGTTQAALDVLMNGDFQEILNKTLKAAKARSKEL